MRAGGALPWAALLWIFGALSTAGLGAAHACAGCRNPSLPATRGNEGPLSAGAFRVGASLAGTAVHVVHDAGCPDLDDCDEVPVQPAYLHDQHLYPFELRVSAEHGLTRVVGLEAQLPLRLVSTRIDYTTPEGQPYEPLDPGIHHRNETLVGLADPWLLLRGGQHVGVVWLAARVGVSVPLGSTEPDPFVLGDRGQRHQHVQLGSGTFDPVCVLELGAPLDTWSLRIFAQGQLSLYDNAHGYRAPTRLYGGASVGHAVVGALSASLGLDASHETPERWSGTVRQDGNLGRSELLGALGVSYGAGAGTWSLDVRVPIARRVVQGEQAQGSISAPVALSLGYAHVFGDPERDRAR